MSVSGTGVKAGHESTVQEFNNGLAVTKRQKDKTKSLSPLPYCTEKYKLQLLKKKYFVTVPGFWFRNMAKTKIMFETKTSTPFNIQKGTVN